MISFSHNDIDLPVGVEIPRDSIIKEIRGKYGPLAMSVRCGLSSCHAMHKRGFLVIFATDHLSCPSKCAVIGHICGKNAFGESWSKATRDYNKRVRQEENLVLLSSFSERTDRILPMLRDSISKLRRSSKLKNDVYTYEPRLKRLFQESWRNEGKISSQNDRAVSFILKNRSFWCTDIVRRSQDLNYEILRAKGKISSQDYNERTFFPMIAKFIADIERQWTLTQKEVRESQEALEPINLQKLLEKTNNIIASTSSRNQWYLFVRVRDNNLEFREYEDEDNGIRGKWTIVENLSKP